jgi:hypothetical protein
MNRQRLVLTLVVGLLLLALGYAYWASPRQQKVAATGAPKAGAARGERGAASPERPRGTLRLDLLEREEESFPGFKRDLFSLQKPAPPPAPLPPARPLPAPTPVPPASTQAPGMDSPARALGQFVFLGFLKKEGEKTLFLSSQGELYVAKKGDAFGKNKEFVISEVGAESLTIRHAHGSGSITVSLVEQQPLTPVSGQSQSARPPRPGMLPMTIQPLPEDLARQAAESGGVEEPAPEAEAVPEEVQEEPVEEPAPLRFGPQRPAAPAQNRPAAETPPGAPTPPGLQLPGMN